LGAPAAGLSAAHGACLHPSRGFTTKNKLFMKKLLYVFITALAMLSCSDDSSTSEANNIKMTLDGEEIIFSNISVTEESFPAEGDIPAYTELTVSAVANENILSFFVIKGEVGEDLIYNINYTENDIIYFGTDISSTTETNGDDKHLVGTFQGSLDLVGPQDNTRQLTNGSFHIKY
jgi:hypothetical protein